MTAVQEDLFGHARSSDPETSKVAGAAVCKESALRVLDVIWRFRHSMSTFTDGELAERCRDFEGIIPDRNIVAARRKDLERFGYVETCLVDGRPEQRPGGRGRNNNVSMLTALGIAVAANREQVSR